MTENSDSNKNLKIKIDIREEVIGDKKEIVVNGWKRESLIYYKTLHSKGLNIIL